MKGETLTIIVNNIPNDTLKSAWSCVCKTAEKTYSNYVTPVDTITIDFKQPLVRKVVELIASAMALHCVAIGEQQDVNVNNINDKLK